MWGCAAIVAVQLTASAQTLAHRYSFSDTDDGAGNVGKPVADSVGGAAWNGTLPNGGTFSGTQLSIFASGPQYVQLPVGILSNYTAVTIDTWVTFGTLPVNCFFFGFGATDLGGVGENYIFCAPQGGRIAIAPGDPGYTYEQGCGGAGNLSSQYVHVTAVFNPPSGYIALYKNGVLISQNDAVTASMSSISNALNYIGKSLYNGDPYPDISLDEFRIYNGSLSPLQVAANDLSGPDVSPAASYGTITNLQLQIGSPVAIGASSGPATVTAMASGLPNPVVLNVPDVAIAYTSANTNTATVNPTNGIVTGIGSGTVNIIASFGGQFATQAVQVISLPTTMIHRYSFSETTTNNGDVVHDSIGTANGIFYNDSGLSAITNGQLVLNGTDKGDYVDLGSNIVSATNIANNALTFEAWATINPGNGIWTRLWDFGTFQAGGTIGSSGGQDYWSFMPSQNPATLARMELSHGGNVDVNNLGNFLGRTNVHIVGVFNPNPSRQFFGVYVNGVLLSSASTGGRPLSSINDVYSWLGRSLWSGDSALGGSINEFRIYNGELNRFQVAASDQSGPNTTNFNVGTFTSYSLNAGSNSVAAGAALQVQAVMNFSLVTNVVVNGDATLTFTSSDASVAAINNAGNLTPLKSGSVTVTGIYGYVSGATTTYYTNSVVVSVFKDYPATLMHRYSFTSDSDTSDSVGGPVWAGTLVGSATVSGGQLVLPNATTAAPALDYLQLPAGILTNAVNGIGTNFNDPTVTVEAWITCAPAQYTWANLFDFGSEGTNGASAAYDLHNAINSSGGFTVTGISDSDNANLDTQFASSQPALSGMTNIHVVCVFDPPAGYLSCYTNGVFMNNVTGVRISMAGVIGVLNKVGADNWPDPGMKGSVDELRIYNGVLHPDEIKADYLAGPNSLPVSLPSIGAAVSGGNLMINWPTNGTSGFILQSSTTLGAGAAWSTVSGSASVAGQNYQQSVPITNSARFFRLSH